MEIVDNPPFNPEEENKDNNPNRDVFPKSKTYSEILNRMQIEEQERIKKESKNHEKKAESSSFNLPELESPGMISRGMDYVSDLFVRGFSVLKELPYQIIAPAVLGLTIGISSGVLSYNHEAYRDSKKHLGFSEISQIIDDASKEGLVTPEGKNPSQGMARTLYQAGLNDLTMKIIEDSDLAHETDGNFYWNFSDRLKERLDPTKKRHKHELKDLFEMVSESSGKIKEQYAHLASIGKRIPEIARSFNDSWKEDHHDNYHTEMRVIVYTTSDGKGNTQTHTMIVPEQVYDNTDHYYYYNSERGNNSAAMLEELIRSSGDIRIKEPYYLARKVNKENRDAIIKSRTEGEVPKLSENDLIGIVNTWYSGSTLVLNERDIYGTWANLVSGSKEWENVRVTAKDCHKRTYSHTDSGPVEYQIAYGIRDGLNEVNKNLYESISLLNSNDKDLPKLMSRINDLVNERSTKEKKKIGKEVLGLTQEIYSANFKRGFEVDRFRTGMVALWSILGTLGGAALGFGAGYLIDKRREDDYFY